MNLTFFAAACKAPGLFLGIFPTWYQYIVDPSTCQPAFKSLSDVWLIVAAIIDILLRLASVVAVIFVIYGGIMFTTSQGSPDQTKQARNTVINALIGLAISVTASIFIGFLAGQIK
jgi:ABC-type Fe3+ transport system permease subunit